MPATRWISELTLLTVASVITLAVLVYSTGQDEQELKHETPISIFHPTFLVMCAGVSAAFLAGDLFNLFVSFEMLLFASYVLLTLGGTAVLLVNWLHVEGEDGDDEHAVAAGAAAAGGLSLPPQAAVSVLRAITAAIPAAAENRRVVRRSVIVCPRFVVQ